MVTSLTPYASFVPVSGDCQNSIYILYSQLNNTYPFPFNASPGLQSMCVAE